MPRPELVVANGDVRLAVRDYGGSGADLVLLHGAGDNLRSLGALVPHLRPHHRVVAADIRGHGWSNESPSWTADDLVADLEAIIDALALANPFVAGHSLGGMIAAFYGARHPECPGVSNIDGHGRGGPAVAAGIRAELEALSLTRPESIPEDSGDASWLEANLAARRAQVEAAGVAWSAAEGNMGRNFVLESDGRYHRRPSNRMTALFGAEIQRWQLFELYRTIEGRLQIFNCTRMEPGIPEHLYRGMRAGIATDLELLVEDRPGTRVVTMDIGHGGVVIATAAELAGHLVEFTGSGVPFA